MPQEIPQEQWQQECRQLEKVLAQLAQLRQETGARLAALPSIYYRASDAQVLAALTAQMSNRLYHLGNALKKPYFARIDFCEAGAPRADACYIGKVGFEDGEEQLITVDWRAPIAALYYDSNIGPAAYEAPGGRVQGQLLLKRQLEVEEGVLLSCQDVDTVSNDELLRPYLGVTADHRLKNIVATIQQEQNRIIRAPLGENLVVQGVAGSGKTTVALHRIAYLVYNHRQQLRPEQYLVIGPNDYFMRYIASVLPDLDVGGVPQRTFEALVAGFVGQPLAVQPAEERLGQLLAGQGEAGCDRWQCSMACQRAARLFMEQYDRSAPPAQDFAPGGIVLLTAAQVAGTYAQLDPALNSTIAGKDERCALQLCQQLKDREADIAALIDRQFRQRLSQPGADAARLQRERASLQRQLGEGFLPALRRHLGAHRIQPLALYRRFLQALPGLCPDEPLVSRIRREGLARLRRGQLQNCDLPALLYLTVRLRGCGAFEQLRHAVVDEAQDLGPFAFFALRQLLPRATFTLVGDLAQAIYSHQGVQSWQQVIGEAFGGRAQLCQMQKSYRTTVEIMQAANRVTAALGLPPAQAVIRHGEPVRLHRPPAGQAARTVAGLLAGYRQQGYGSAAVIVKTGAQARQLAGELAALGSPVALMLGKEEFNGGYCLLTAQLAKGLEFDAVVLADADGAHYRPGHRPEQLLLYVAMTRPLHRLDLVQEEGMPPLAEENFQLSLDNGCKNG